MIRRLHRAVSVARGVVLGLAVGLVSLMLLAPSAQANANKIAPILRDSLERVWQQLWRDFIPAADAKIRGAASIFIDHVPSDESREAAVGAMARSLEFAARKPFEKWRSALAPSLRRRSGSNGWPHGCKKR